MKKLFAKYIPRIYGAYFNLLSIFSTSKAAEKAFYTFCKIRKGKILPNQRDFLEPHRDKFIDVKGHELQTYRWEGSQETVLLVHGWESNSFRWRNLIGFLQKKKYNIIAFDAPGHGNSTGDYLHVPLYTDCLQQLIRHYSPAYLVAHSVGGMAALYHQYKYPDSSVEKIVTIGSPSEFHEIMSHFQGLLKLNNRVMKALDNYVMEHFGFAIRDFSTSRFVESNSKKGLLLHDRLDSIAPFHASENVHSHWKNSEFIITEGLGHSMHQAEVNQKIIDFLKT